MTQATTIGATNLRLHPGDYCSPIALGEQTAKLITNQRRTGEERTPGYVISRTEWNELVEKRPSSKPPKDKIQAYRVGQSRDVLYPKILVPAALEGVHTFIVALGTMASSRARNEQLDLLELDFDDDREVAWSVAIVPTQWYETLTGANARAEYDRGDQ